MDGFLYFLPDQAPPPPPPPPTTSTQTQDPGAAPAQAPSPAGGIMQMLPMLVIMFVVFYFLMIRPQNKQRREREAMITNLKKNDKVLTSFGIYGIVKQIGKPEDPDIVLCIDESKDVRIRVSKASIASLEKASGGDGEPKPEAQGKAKS